MTPPLCFKLPQSVAIIALLFLFDEAAIAQTYPSILPQTNLCAKISPDTLFVGVTLSPGKDSTQCVRVTNCGDTTEVFNATVGSGDYFVSPKTSPAIPVDSSFTFCVTFHPKNAGDKQAFLFINIDASQIYYVPMFASTPCPHLRADPLSFGQILAGQKAVKSLSIVNDGSIAWKPGAPSFFPDNGVYSVISPDLDTLTIPAQTTIVATIQYAPIAFGKDSTVLSFPNAGPCGNKLVIPISGRADCALLQAENFSVPNTGVGETTRFIINISNGGDLDWNSGTATIIGLDSDAFRIISLLPSVVGAGNRSTATVEFTPKFSGQHTARITFPNAGPCGNNLQLDLSGVGACANLTSGNPGTITTTKGHTIQFTITIINTGIVTWNSGAAVLTGSSITTYRIVSIVPNSIKPGDTMTITLEFDPPYNGNYSASLTFPNSTPCQSVPLSIFLKGTGVTDGVGPVASNGFSLDQNFPNPFTSETSFEYIIPKESEIRITINDLAGKLVKTVVSGRVSQGEHLVHFKTSDMPSGTYILLLESGSVRLTRELILTK